MDTQPAAAARPGLGHFVGVVSIFLFMGPFIGALTFAVMMTVMHWLLDPGSPVNPLFFWVTIMGLPMAYLIGGLQALVTGVVVAAVHRQTGRISMLAATLAAAAGAGVYSARLDQVDGITFVMLAVHLLPALACFWIARRSVGSPRTVTIVRN